MPASHGSTAATSYIIKLTGDAWEIDIEPEASQSVSRSENRGWSAQLSAESSTSQDTGDDVDRRLSTARCDLLRYVTINSIDGQH